MSHHEQEPPNPKKDFDPILEGIKHADSGYKNAQDIIKFIDTKAGVIAGFAFVCIGVVLQGIKEFLGFSKDIQNSIIEALKPHPAHAWMIYASLTFSMAIGIFTVLCVVRCVTARPPRIASKLKHTTLF